MEKLISEPEIRRAALKELAASANGKMSTSRLIEVLTKSMNPVGRDAEIALGRSDTYFSQKVRNLVSHRNQGPGLEVSGLAYYDPVLEGWEITEKGRKYIAGRGV